MEYTIKTPAENPAESVIEKKGVLVHFTLAELDAMDGAYEKKLLEINGRLEIDGARKKNIEDHHPFVLTMSGEDLVAAFLYEQAKQAIAEALPRRDALVTQLAEDKAEREIILSQLPELAPKVEVADLK